MINLTEPMIRISLDFCRLLSFDMTFDAIAEGKTAIAKILSRTVPDTNSLPIIERIGSAPMIKHATTGVVKLRLILNAPEDKSLPVDDEAGIDIYAMLVAKLPATTLIITVI
jgi:hypothetical protein